MTNERKPPSIPDRREDIRTSPPENLRRAHDILVLKLSETPPGDPRRFGWQLELAIIERRLRS